MKSRRTIQTIEVLCLRSTGQSQDFVRRTASVPDRKRFSFLVVGVLNEAPASATDATVYTSMKCNAGLRAVLQMTMATIEMTMWHAANAALKLCDVSKLDALRPTTGWPCCIRYLALEFSPGADGAVNPLRLPKAP